MKKRKRGRPRKRPKTDLEKFKEIVKTPPGEKG